MRESSLVTFNEGKEKDGAKIEWARWSWNPVTGCKHNCPYCYARDFAKRFYPQGFEPTFHVNRLPAPYNTKFPKVIHSMADKNVFVCSMADLFGSWVPEEWITKILTVCADASEWNYLFLTKNPSRYLEFKYSKNMWLGTTIDVESRLKSAQQIFRKLKIKKVSRDSIRFVSFEPLEEDMGIPDLSMFNWIIIGGRSSSTGMPQGQPEWEWVEKLLFAARKHNCKVYFKPNLLVRPKEYCEEVS